MQIMLSNRGEPEKATKVCISSNGPAAGHELSPHRIRDIASVRRFDQDWAANADIGMLKSLLHRLRVKRTPAPGAPTAHLQKASVEQIWSTWRFEKPASEPPRNPASRPPTGNPRVDPPIRRSVRSEQKPPSQVVRPASLAERVAQLKRMGEYEDALELALLEIVREEKQSAWGEKRAVPWYYWEAAIVLRKLERFDDEQALIRRFARNYDIHFRSFSRRHRSMPSARDAWAASFLGRLEDSKTAAERRAERRF